MTWDNTFALTEGVHTLYVEAWDNANNHVSSSVTFRVGTIAPVVSITSPASGYYSSSSTVSVVWTATDGGSGVQGYEYRIDGDDWSSMSGGKTHSFSGLGEGNHTVYVRATDNSSNTAETSVTFNVDTIEPSVQIDSPANLFITNVTTVTVNWSGSDETSGVAGYQYQLDSGSWSSLSMVQSYVFTGLSNAVHTVNVMVHDRAGNTQEASVQFTMDNMVPYASHRRPGRRIYTGLTSMTVVWHGSDSLSGIQGYQYSLDGAAWSTSSMEVSQAFVGLSEGDHTVRIMATDNAQNYHIVSVLFHVDRQPRRWSSAPRRNHPCSTARR